MTLKINDRIRNRTVKYFSRFALDIRYDSVASVFSFDFFFDPDSQEHVDLACLGHYHLATLEHNDELLLTGFILSATFESTSGRNPVKCSGYSLPGVLEDCNIPPSLYPLQSDGLTLKEITDKLLRPFKIRRRVDPAVAARMNTPYKTTTARESQTIKAYLSELASQKQIIMSHTPAGELLFTEANTDKPPILHFTGGIPSIAMNLTFNGQPMHSHITVLKQADIDGGNSGEATVKNPYVPYVYRPKVIVQSSGTDIDTIRVAKAALAEELKHIKLVIKTDRWEIDGSIIKPNNTILVENKEVYSFNPVKWFIESVRLEGNKDKTVATLTCVLPEVYNGRTPKYIFKHINTHG